MPNGQMGAVTVGGLRRRRSPYREMIEAQAPYLPEMYRLREEKAEREREYQLRQKEFELSEEAFREQKKAQRIANIIGAAQVGTQGYLGYKLAAGGGGAGAVSTPQVSAVAGGAGAGAGGAGGMTGAQLAMEGGTAGGAGAGASQVIPWLFAAYIGYKIWQGEKRMGAEYPGQPFVKSVGKSLSEGWKSLSKHWR